MKSLKYGICKRFDYCCKNCWHTWRSLSIFKKCPKCGSNRIDVKSELVL